MPGITRHGDVAGGSIISSQRSVYANGRHAIVDGDGVSAHPPCPIVPIHCAPTMVAGTNNVYIEGTQAVNQGDPATCGHPASGSNNVFIGD